jgi:hypothetical protein
LGSSDDPYIDCIGDQFGGVFGVCFSKDVFTVVHDCVFAQEKFGNNLLAAEAVRQVTKYSLCFLASRAQSSWGSKPF